MDQYIDNRHKEIFFNSLANPVEAGSLYASNIERLINDHPQSGILKALLARTGDKENIKKAAAAFNPKALYKLVNDPDGLRPVLSKKIVTTTSVAYEPENYFNIGVVNEDDDTAITETQSSEDKQAPAVVEGITTAESVNLTDETVIELPEQAFSTVSEPAGNVNGSETETPEEEESADELNTDEVTLNNEQSTEITDDKTTGTESPAEMTSPVQELEAFNRETAIEINTPAAEADQKTISSYAGYRPDFNRKEDEKEYFRQDIEDDIYDEIVSIDDIGFEALKNTSAEEIDNASSANNENDQPEETADQTTSGLNIDDDQQLLANVAATDYFLFDKKLNELRETDTPPVAEAAPEHKLTEPLHEDSIQPTTESRDIARYDDDKMPYTFLWWLSKTRKEHAGAYQPYAKAGSIQLNKQKKSIPNELQQQYYENIFSHTSITGIDPDAQKVEFDHNKKEDIIIERFIHTEPQIKPLAADKLDNENKAKKSAEDQDALVTETLARIYTDQMLYHKAIATYKKLMLKFPEKKLYFAAQIEQLEKRNN
ncbi:hypothetical protein [Mucilaginibacter segetis]|uniref:Tetratricopeptide repeat protein n=1 Tax=Mucilaginibacter segetis TaxID=2793071 RepID=A0A934ULK7_9SPHI|nr:hypothetical protein [Mucilaginibacter segetis]MBK0377947.1 hypothetical protein [Mucilaginibacter segetis]